MSKNVKCKYCGEYSDKEVMVKHNNRYAHKECIDRVANENTLRDKLNKLILELHGINQIPSNWFSGRIAPLRTGKKQGKTIGVGYSYESIIKTYETYSKNIEYAIKTKGFKNVTQMLNYTFAIIESNIWRIDKNIKKAKKKNEIEKELTNNSKNIIKIKRADSKNDRSNGDISELID